MLGVGTKLTPFKPVFPCDFHVSHYHGQHLLMHVDSRYPVTHELPPGGSGVRAATYTNQGRGLSPLPPRETTPIYSLNDARSGSDRNTASTAPLLKRISPLRASAIVPRLKRFS